MVTRWKKSRVIISFLAFALGTSLILSSGSSLAGLLLSGNLRENLREATETDYQNTERFRRYMSDYLETFLTMAVDGPVGDSDEYGESYSYDSRGEDYWDVWENEIERRVSSMVIQSGDASSGSTVELSGIPEWLEQDDVSEKLSDNEKLSDEEKLARAKEIYVAAAKKIHEEMKNDKNLLYTISYDGQEKYGNTEGMRLNGAAGTLPEGYNFLLYFDGEKVKIFKDGKEVDVYGNGFYSEDSQWYVPGYSNFSVDDSTKKATVCIAAAKNPMIYVRGDYSVHGTSYRNNELYWVQENMEQNKSFYARRVLALLFGIALFAFYIWRREDKKQADKAIAGWTGRLWFELKVLAVIFIGIVTFASFPYSISDILQMMLWGEISYRDMIYYAMDTGFLLIFFWAAYLLVNDLRYNSKPWKCSFCGFVNRLICGNDMELPVQRRIVRRYGMVLGAELIIIGILLVGSGAYLLMNYYYYINSIWGLMALTLLALCAAAVVILPGFLYAKCNREIAEDLGAVAAQVESIRGGNLEQSVKLPEDTDLQALADSLNDIQRGMKAALEEQTKSERMKVELITNVSHDLKTPLTSIITYAELLREEPGLPEHVQDYVQILNDKSRRLKSMVQDVFEVSKAASGQLPVDLETLDFGKLLRQTLADMAERIDASAVTIRTSISAEPVMIVADGKRLYRVFQNLIQNALQYSLDGSRVFITLTADGRRAVAGVKNTSALEICSEMDFTERFARGDQSRSDGGSGLGLSIARSFTEACGGTMKVEPIADLFVVTVEFDQLPRTRTGPEMGVNIDLGMDRVQKPEMTTSSTPGAGEAGAWTAALKMDAAPVLGADVEAKEELKSESELELRLTPGTDADEAES